MPNFDSYYDPPDELEAVPCDDCGGELEDEWDAMCREHTYKCANTFCPSKHEGIAKEMAIRLVELLYDNHLLTGKNKYLLWREKTLVEHLKMEGKKIVEDS